MRLRRACTAAFAALLSIAFTASAAAQWAPSYEAIRGMDESFRIDIGGFFQKFDTTVQRYKSDGTPGMEINLEDVLGQDSSKTTIRVDGIWRFGRHGNLQFGYRGWSRSNDHVLGQDIEWGDNVYHVGAVVSTRSNQHLGQLYYGYSVVNTGELEIGMMLGVSTYFNKFSVSTSGSVTGPGGGGAVASTADEENFVAPIPATGAYFSFTLLPKFFFFAKVRWLPKLTISGRSASMVDATAGLDIYFTKNVGIGGGYEYTKFTYEHATANGVRLDMNYSGPLAYLTLAF